MKNLLDRKAFSNPDSSANIQVLQKVLRKQASPEFRRKFSSNPKLGIKNVTEVPQALMQNKKQKKERSTVKEFKSDHKKPKKKGKTPKTIDKLKKAEKSKKKNFKNEARKTTFAFKPTKKRNRNTGSDTKDYSDCNFNLSKRSGQQCKKYQRNPNKPKKEEKKDTDEAAAHLPAQPEFQKDPEAPLQGNLTFKQL